MNFFCEIEVILANFFAGAEDTTDSYAGVPLPTLYSGDRDQSKMGELHHVIRLNCQSSHTAVLLSWKFFPG